MISSTNPPTVGRIVHYVAFGSPGGEYAAGAHRAAIVVDVDRGVPEADVVTLAIFNPTGLHFRPGVEYDENEVPAPGTWHWPEYSK